MENLLKTLPGRQVCHRCFPAASVAAGGRAPRWARAQRSTRPAWHPAGRSWPGRRIGGVGDFELGYVSLQALSSNQTPTKGRGQGITFDGYIAWLQKGFSGQFRGRSRVAPLRPATKGRDAGIVD